MSDKGSVLLVDDQPDRAVALVAALESTPFRFEVTSGAPDLEAVLGPESPWDCLLFRVDLTDVSWPSVRRALRGFDVQVPVIAITDDRDLESMSIALALGVTDFLAQPVERAGLLMRSIERAVHHRHLQRDLINTKERLEEANAELSHSLAVLEQDQQSGRQVQRAMLPAQPLRIQDYCFSYRIIPSLYLSGDFTDFFQVGEDRVAFFLADVSGHGSSSAFTTVLLKNLFARKRSDYFRRSDQSITDPVVMLNLANSELLELAVKKYATMVVGVLNMSDNSLCYSVAGHLPLPILFDDSGCRYLEGGGSPVGLLPKPQYQKHELALSEQFMFLAMSDGVLETLQATDLIEQETELLSLLQGPAAKPGELVDRVGLADADRRELVDDIAGLFVSRGLVG